MTYAQYRLLEDITQANLAQYLGVTLASICKAEQRGAQVPNYHKSALARLSTSLDAGGKIKNIIRAENKRRAAFDELETILEKI